LFPFKGRKVRLSCFGERNGREGGWLSWCRVDFPEKFEMMGEKRVLNRGKETLIEN
jgi:hypothetical protein